LRSNNAQWDFWSLSPESLRWGAGDQGMMFARFFRTRRSGRRDAFADQLAAALDSGAMFSFTFGIISAEAIAAVRQRGMLLAGTATTVDEAIALEESGVEVVIAEGSEAGGHRGSFLAILSRQ